MAKYRDILRLRSLGDQSWVGIAAKCGCSDRTVRRMMKCVVEHGLKWPLPPEMTDEWLKRLVYVTRAKEEGKRTPDYDKLLEEMTNISINYSKSIKFPPKLRLHMCRGQYITVYKDILYNLGSPKSFQFWWSAHENMLLIGRSEAKAHQSVNVDDYYYRTKSSFKIRERGFLRMIMILTKWDKDADFDIYGEYVPELDMVGFRMEKANIREVV